MLIPFCIKWPDTDLSAKFVRVAIGFLLLLTVPHAVSSQVLPDGILIHLRSDTGIVQDNSKISMWTDISGHGNNVIMPDTTERPIFLEQAVNGKPTVLFQGGQYLIGPSIFPHHHDYTIGVVVKINNSTNLNNLVSGNGHALWLDQDLYPRVVHYYFQWQEVATVPLWQNDYSSVVALYSDTDGQSTIFVNGEFADSSWVQSNTDSVLYIGSYIGGYFLQGEIQEVILYDRKLNPTEQSTLSDYFLNRYGIARGLPSPKPDSTFAEIPKQLQIYPRGDDDSATVPISGSIYRSGFDSITVEEYKNNTYLSTLASPLIYSDGKAPFRLEPRIHAERSEYAFEVHLRSGTRDTLLIRRDSIACGDILLIDGQSNASFGFDVDTFRNEFCRTFGLHFSQNLRDTTWEISNANKWGDDAGVGAWGQQLQKDLLLHGLPSCCINGSLSGTSISSHQRDSSNKYNLQTVYGRQLYRTTESGLLNAAKALFWDQGELNYATGYFDSFRKLFHSWKEDYPNLQKVYLLQNRPNYCGWGNIDIRDVQREISDSIPEVEAIATAAIAGQNGCHYYDSGYMALGDRLYLSLARDLYHSADTADLRSPKTTQAYYSRRDRTQITIEFWPPDVKLHATPDTTVDSVFATLKDYLYPDDTSAHISSLEFRGNKMVINFDRPTHATTIGYLPDQYYNGTKSIYEGPWIVNARGIGALLWSHLDIRDNPLSVDDGTLVTAAQIFPNPANGFVTIERGTLSGPLTARLSSSLGSMVWQSAIPANETTPSLDLTSLPAGCYTLELASQDKRLIRKVILIR